MELKSDRLDPEKDIQILDQFLISFLHEIRNPLQAMHLTLELFRRQIHPDLNPKTQVTLDRISKVKEELEEVVKAASLFRRVRAHMPKNEPVDLKTLAGNFRPEGVWREGDMIITESPLPTIMSDSMLLRLIFENILMNGLKFNAQPERKIEVSFEQVDSCHMIHFTDNGIGIPAQYIGELFKPFRRLTDRYGEGTGLGLFLAQAAAQKLGGSIQAKSTLLEGSTFTVMLPAPSAI